MPDVLCLTLAGWSEYLPWGCAAVMGAMRTAGYEDKKAAFEDRAYR